MSDALKPCPFCGCEGDDLDVIETSGTAYVHCNNCDSDGPFSDATNSELAVSEWNTRAAPPTTAEGEAKPFGWLGKWNNGTYDFFTTQEEIDKWSASGALQVTPIYTAPPSTAEAQARALEDAVKKFSESQGLEWGESIDPQDLLDEAKRIREGE